MVEASETSTIDNWCARGRDHCKHHGSHTIRPFKCLGEYKGLVYAEWYICISIGWYVSGFPLRRENLENGHGKVMEHEQFAKSHGIL